MLDMFSTQILQAMSPPEACPAPAAPASGQAEPIASVPSEAERVWIPPVQNPGVLQPAKAAVYSMLVSQVLFAFPDSVAPMVLGTIRAPISQVFSM